jgi:hypothetical protein
MEAAPQLQMTKRKNQLMTTRRHFIVVIGIAVLALAADVSSAAPPTVEIIAMGHPPVQSALRPLREWLARQGGRLRVVEVDAEGPQGEKRLAAIGLTGHVPIVILIDGKRQYRRKDGSTVSFVNFPAVKESPPGIRGDWLIEDVQAALTERMNMP